MTERYWLAGGTKPVRALTHAALRYGRDERLIVYFDLYMARVRLATLPLAMKARAPTNVSTELLDSPKQGSSEKDESTRKSARLEPNDFDYSRHAGLVTEMILVRVVDNFLAYISDILAVLYTSRPEMLRSAEQERLDFILQFSTMTELVAALAERRVERLAFMGLRELNEYLEKQAAFALFPNKADFDRAALLVESRNIIVHNRGVISNVSVRRIPALKDHLGARIMMDEEMLRDHRQFLEHSVFDIDERAATKFRLHTEPFEHPVGDA